MLQHFDPNKDYGTPASLSETLVTLEIDGVEITVPEGTSVMRAAALADINIPKLCATDNLEAFGIWLLPPLRCANRRPSRHTSLLYHTCRARHESVYSKRKISQIAPQYYGIVYFRSPVGLPDLSSKRRL